MLQKIEITGLFHKFDYEIELKPEGITILTGPNGYGKTTILRMIDAFGKRSIAFFLNLPFSRIAFIQEGIETSISKKSGNILAIQYGNGKPIEIDRNAAIEEAEKLRPILEDTLSKLQGIRDAMEDSVRKEKELFDDLRNYENAQRFLSNKLGVFQAEWLTYPFSVVYFIREQRLVKRKPEGTMALLSDYDPDRPLGEVKEVLESSVVEYAKELSSIHIKNALAEASRIGQELDGSFPERLFNQSDSISEEEFNRRYDAVREKQNTLSRYGLSTTREERHTSFKEENAKALLVYLNDTEEKLAAFDGILEKLELFSSILSKKQFAGKEIEISPDLGFRFRTEDGKELPLTALSSGEQQEVVLLYELLFKVGPDTLLLIDEPEISLHVAWQKEFLDDLSRIVKLQGMKVILATHSPDIIGKYWDWVVDLYEISA